MNKTGMVKVQDIQLPNPIWRSPVDSTFAKLFASFLDGSKVPIFHGQVPLRLIQPFAPNHRVDISPYALHGLNLALEYGQPAWVYPQDGMLILSDDYFAFEAARLVKATHLNCFILGNPPPEVEEVEGPLDPDKVRRAIGILPRRGGI